MFSKTQAESSLLKLQSKMLQFARGRGLYAIRLGLQVSGIFMSKLVLRVHVLQWKRRIEPVSADYVNPVG